MTGAGARLVPAARGWWLVTAALLLGALLMSLLPATLADWQPELALVQPWRAISAVWVHWSDRHLFTNLLATVVVGAFGAAARVPPALAWAWLVAWPLTHLGLVLKPDLLHYGGLSGVLHAGVAIVCLHLLVSTQGARRWIGAGVALGLLAKVVSEKPWGDTLQVSADWDIAVAPLAHATGTLAGVLCAGFALLLARVR